MLSTYIQSTYRIVLTVRVGTKMQNPCCVNKKHCFWYRTVHYFSKDGNKDKNADEDHNNYCFLSLGFDPF